MTLGKFVLGIFIVAIGFVIIWKSEWLLINFGRIGFAEKHLGTEGGSRLMYKLAGTLIIITGLMYATDLTDEVIRWFVKAVFKRDIPES